jgi:peptidoglycan/LPS O-acetylase OafA/YrhL
MHPSSQRLESLDVLRGIAVVIMVLGHSVDSVLSPAVRATDMFRVYDAVRGFTAPLFLFISGLAFMVATERRWEEYRVPGPLVAKRLGRILFLLIVGYALHLPYFSFEKVVAGATSSELAQLAQVDVLHCVAVTLLMLQIIVMLSRTPAVAAAIAAGLAAVIALAAPVLWSTDLSGVLPQFLTPYLNSYQPSVFPVVPYAVYMLAGAAVGRLYLGSRAKGTEPVVLGRALVISAVGAALGVISALVPAHIYPLHDWWKANPGLILIRLFVVFTLAASFLGAGPLPRPLSRPLVALGRASFLIYAVHLILVYGSSANDGLMQLVGQRLGMTAALAVATAVLLAMTAMVHGHAYLRTQHAGRLATVRMVVATAVTYVFLTRPY